MTDEEKKAIEYLKNRLEILHNNTQWATEDSIKVVLNLIEKRKEEVEQLANGIRVLGTNPDITTEEIIKEFTEKPITEEYMKEFKNRYISKDEVLKALGYEENDEEYKRIYNKDELIISLIRTINEECDRLEDIEDQKTLLEIHNIENQRDKYWEKKINNKIKEIGSETQYLLSDKGETKQNYAIRKFYELLEE